MLTSRFVMIIIIVVVVGGPLQGEIFRPYQSACRFLRALNIRRSQRHFLLRDLLYAYSRNAGRHLMLNNNHFVNSPQKPR